MRRVVAWFDVEQPRIGIIAEFIQAQITVPEVVYPRQRPVGEPAEQNPHGAAVHDNEHGRPVGLRQNLAGDHALPGLFGIPPSPDTILRASLRN